MFSSRHLSKVHLCHIMFLTIPKSPKKDVTMYYPFPVVDFSNNPAFQNYYVDGVTSYLPLASLEDLGFAVSLP